MSDVVSDKAIRTTYMLVSVIRMTTHMDEKELEKRAKFMLPEGPCIQVHAINDQTFCENMRAARNERLNGLDDSFIFLLNGEGYTWVKESWVWDKDKKNKYKVAPFFRQQTNKKVNVDADRDVDDNSNSRVKALDMLDEMLASMKLHVIRHCTYWSHLSTATKEMFSLLPDNEKWVSPRITEVTPITENPVNFVKDHVFTCPRTLKSYTVDFAVLRSPARPDIFIDVQTRRSDAFHDICKELNVEYVRLTSSAILTRYGDEVNKCKLKGEPFTDQFPACDKIPLFHHSNFDNHFVCAKCYPIWQQRMATCGDAGKAAELKKSEQQLDLEKYESQHVANFDKFNKTANSASKTDAVKMTETRALAAELEGKWMKIGYIRIYNPKWVHFFFDKNAIFDKDARAGNLAVKAELLPKDAEPLLKKLSKISEALDENSRIMSSGKRKVTDTPLFCFVKVKGLKYIVPGKSNYSCKQIDLTNPADIQQGTHVPGAPGRS